jgi:hypothetical protein
MSDPTRIHVRIGGIKLTFDTHLCESVDAVDAREAAEDDQIKIDKHIHRTSRSI